MDVEIKYYYVTSKGFFYIIDLFHLTRQLFLSLFSEIGTVIVVLKVLINSHDAYRNVSDIQCGFFYLFIINIISWLAMLGVVSAYFFL